MDEEPEGFPFARLILAGLVLGLVYLIIGVIIAADRDYFDGISNFDELFSAIGEVLFWPLVAVGIDITLR